jgi:hypothetical protein
MLGPPVCSSVLADPAPGGFCSSVVWIFGFFKNRRFQFFQTFQIHRGVTLHSWKELKEPLVLVASKTLKNRWLYERTGGKWTRQFHAQLFVFKMKWEPWLYTWIGYLIVGGPWSWILRTSPITTWDLILFLITAQHSGVFLEWYYWSQEVRTLFNCMLFSGSIKIRVWQKIYNSDSI